jgi:hypothetical protein
LTEIATADLKFDYDEDEGRSWVNTYKFAEFIEQHEEIQENSSLNNGSSVQFNIKVKLKNITDAKIEYRNAFPPMTTVYGGVKGIQAFLKTIVIDTVYAYESSGYEILAIELKRLYIDKLRQTTNADFSRIKMYGTVFNYKGFMLDAIETKTPNCCVPEYIHDLLYNPTETDFRKRIAKLKIQDVLNDLEMTNIDEGCCIEQIAKLCNKRKVTYYALDYRYKLFKTNKDMKYINNLPRLVFVCANNHLYPITDHEKRETIFKTYSTIGGKIKTYKTMQAIEHKKQDGKKSHIFEHLEDMSFYALYEHVKQLKKDDKDHGDYRIIMSRGLCNSLFYDEIRVFKNIHNGKIKLSKGNTVIGFEMGGIIIDENEHYQEIKIAISTLNETISKEKDKYKYTGQSLQSLAYA